MSASYVCELFRQCLNSRQGDDWREFVDRYGPRIRRIVAAAARQGGVSVCEPDLDELVQDLYCRLLMPRQQRFKGRSENELWRFLAKASFNLMVDQQRSSRAKKRRPETRSTGRPPRRSWTAIDPEQRLLGKERRKIFLERCREVTHCDRMVLEIRVLAMALLEGWSSREIAIELEGLSACQIDSLVCRLRRHLAKDGIRLPRRVCVPVAAYG